MEVLGTNNTPRIIDATSVSPIVNKNGFKVTRNAGHTGSVTMRV